MKKILVLILAITIMFSTVAFANDGEISVILDGTKLEFDVPPQLINDRTMVPLRAIFEALGATVTWYEDTQTVIGYTPGISLQLTIGSTEITINTIENTIDVPPQIINERTLVPLRVVSESLGVDVEWVDATQTVILTSQNRIGQYRWNDTYDYYGELTNGVPDGYGEFYNKNTDTTDYVGIFDSNGIIEGTEYFDNGDVYTGTFDNFSLTGTGMYYWESSGNIYYGDIVNGEFTGYGTMLYNNKEGIVSYEGYWINGMPETSGTICYASGSKYVGEISNGYINGYGTMNYYDGSYHSGYWVNGEENGQGVWYNSEYNCTYTGNYVNGKREGLFTICDLSSGEKWTVEYINDQYISEEAKKEAERNKMIAEYEQQLADLNEQYKALSEWYEEESAKLLDMILYGNPYEEDWAQSIYEYYGVTPNGTGNDSGNLDSYAAANAYRQQQARLESANAAILEQWNIKISNMQTALETSYQQKLAELDALKANLELKYEMILQMK